MKLTELAPAKLNLTLEVGEKRSDGYHEVQSVMSCAALYDEVTLESGTSGGISMTCDCPGLPLDDTNLCLRAAKLFFKKTGIPCDGLHIELSKRIPMQSGLGGGSADAAAVLRGLRKLYRPEMMIKDLERMAAELGSDVPFCVRSVTAMVRGRGEQLLKLPKLPLCWFVICKPEFSFSTAEMYAKLDEKEPVSSIDTLGLIKALEYQDMQEISDRLGNCFEGVLEENSEIFAIKNRLLALGARNACMSGSGSAVYGLFTQEDEAKAAAAELQKAYPQTWFAESV
jgi:4-diphosphocytidyl-2-C-methyl-D-erythritol kinase